ncbi:MAG: hypothetical protein A3E85_02455 [Gammaproteobacteria bacterium RIFCSPHIGHO2_12_FULL_45_12]|nr:MAG: hypothetical protein A3E85_02455 [Gammaproteobacteria bacterium RIFCSPHIGHO2_12_FULL_45_12]
MLHKRILTAVILVSLVLAAIFYLSPPYFCLATALLVLVAAWEWTNLMRVTSIAWRVLYLLIVLLSLFNALFVPASVILASAFIWWLGVAGLVMVYPRATGWWSSRAFVCGLMGLIVLVPCWAAVNFIRNQMNGIALLLFLFVLIWGADTAAYFIGKQWGKTKLVPAVSPGKSWQGLAGALVFSLVLAFAVLWASGMKGVIWGWFVGFVLIVTLFSVVGDLFESMMKREAGLKDSGTMLPGHGGLLDRIDSLTAAAPIFALGVALLERTGF